MSRAHHPRAAAWELYFTTTARLTERIEAAYRYDVSLAQLLEAAGVSDEFTAYMRRQDARRITFEK